MGRFRVSVTVLPLPDTLFRSVRRVHCSGGTLWRRSEWSFTSAAVRGEPSENTALGRRVRGVGQGLGIVGIGGAQHGLRRERQCPDGTAPHRKRSCHGLLHSVRAGQGIEGLLCEIGEGE